MIRLVFILVALVALMSCGHDDDPRKGGSRHDDTETPSNGNDDESSDEEEYDFTVELDDATSRIESDELTLRYGDAGVMVSMKSTGIEYELRDISTGHYALFKALGDIEEDRRLSNPALEIDGADIALASACVEQVDSRGVWIHIVTLRDEHIVVVVTDL